MRNHSVIIIFILFALSLPAQEIITPEEITPGMKGVGYTVVSGTNIDEFGVEAIGVLRKAIGRMDLIVIRISGLDLERSGIVQGMSGSPIYFDGKLAGALAYGFSYNKDPICLVTPIKSMLDLYGRHTADGGNAFHYPYQKQMTNAAAKVEAPKPIDDTALVRKVSTPLLFSGFNEKVIETYRDAFESYGFLPLIGGGTMAEGDDDHSTFQPGDACAVILADGDFDLSAIGTVTHVEGSHFLALGHPAFGMGRITLPISRAYITTIIPSVKTSFKVGGAIGKAFAHSTFDGQQGIAGAYGVPEGLMVPVTLTIRHGAIRETFSFRVIKHPLLFYDILASALFSGISSIEGMGEEVTVSVGYNVHTAYFDRPLSITNRYLTYASADAFQVGVKDVLAPMQVFMYNRFQRIETTGLDITVDVTPGLAFAYIEEMSLEKTAYSPGDDVPITVRMRDNEGKMHERVITLSIPENVDKGVYGVFIGNDYTYERFQQTYFPARYMPYSVEDIYDLLSVELEPNLLVAWMYVHTQGLVIRGDEYERLPTSYFQMFASQPATDKGILYSVIKEEDETEFLVIGQNALQITVNGDDK